MRPLILLPLLWRLLRRWTLALLFLFTAHAPLPAEIPRAAHPPQLAGLTPPLYPLEYASVDLRRAHSIAVFVDAAGSVVEVDSSALPEPLRDPATAAMHASTFRAASTLTEPTDGFRRVLLRTYFTPVRGEPTPTPQFHFDEAARDKLETIARNVVKSWLRARFTVSSRGEIRAIETQNSRLDGVFETLFENDVAAKHPPFAPAMTDGEPTEGEIDLFWDLTLPSERRDYADVSTGLVQPGDNALPGGRDWPRNDETFKAYVFPHPSNVVVGAYVEPGLPANLRDATLRLAEGWFIPEKNAASPLEVGLRYEADDPTLVVESFRSIEQTSSSLRFSARPIYPKRRFLPNPDGFVRLQLDIARDGWLEAVEILEASHKRFREPALEALEARHFSPMTFDGEAIPSRIFLTLPVRPDEN